VLLTSRDEGAKARFMRYAVKLQVAIAAASLLLAGCGLKGPLELPPEAKAQNQTSASADSGQGKSEDAAPKPHKGFILDGLIR
jgi:predicted small lipoprotein YifL